MWELDKKNCLKSSSTDKIPLVLPLGQFSAVSTKIGLSKDSFFPFLILLPEKLKGSSVFRFRVFTIFTVEEEGGLLYRLILPQRTITCDWKEGKKGEGRK